MKINYINFEFLYDGQIIILVFVVLSLLLLLIKDKKWLLKNTLILNGFFILYFLSATLLERYFEYQIVEMADNLSFIEPILDLLSNNSNRFIGASIYFFINQFVFIRLYFLGKKDINPKIS